ncbi:MAG: sulfate adenylyltransferase subunit 1 [Hyphomicrobiaceae bacterium]
MSATMAQSDATWAPVNAPAVVENGSVASELPAKELTGIIHILTCGSVDDGKSSLIGRLLWDAAALPDDTRASLLASAGADGQPDLSRLVDGLVAEREQGITIDIAWRYFDAGSRRHVIIDSPGHEQYTRNMASGASHADVAIMLVDARHGIKRQTRRHAAILNLVGLRNVILAVNKMDLVGWSEDVFREIENDFAIIAERFGFYSAAAVPVAAKPGDNVVKRSERMPWYSGPTLVDRLNQSPGRGQLDSKGLRFPVQTVLRGATDFRGLAGTISSGEMRVGGSICDSVSGKQARIKRIVTMDGDRDVACKGDAIVVELDNDLDISRGALLADPHSAPHPARILDARIVWLADTPLSSANGLLVRLSTDLVPVAAFEISARLELETMNETECDECLAGDIALAKLKLARPAAVDAFEDNSTTGSFILIDALSGATLAGGVIARIADGVCVEGSATTFMLTDEILARGLCSNVAPGSVEFRRRAEEAAILLRAAGISVSLVLEQDPRACSAEVCSGSA